MYATAEHNALNNKHDATSVWVEEIKTDSFKLCLRELKNFDGIHKSIKVVGIHFYLMFLRTNKKNVCSKFLKFSLAKYGHEFSQSFERGRLGDLNSSRLDGLIKKKLRRFQSFSLLQM